MKIIFESDKTKVGITLLEIIADTIRVLTLMTSDLEKNHGGELLNKIIGDPPVDGMPGLTLRDWYGQLCDTLINQSLNIASILGFDNDDFRTGIDERVGSGKIYDGEYTSYDWERKYFVFRIFDPGELPDEPDQETIKLSKKHKRWWAPTPGYKSRWAPVRR